MKTALLFAAVLMPALAWADDKPYVVYNGRGAGTSGGPSPAAAAPAAAPASQGSNQLINTALSGGAFGTNGVAPGLIPGGGGGQQFTGKRGVTRGFGGFKHSMKGRRVDGTPTGGSGGSTSDPPPYYSKPGALIRTEGQLPKYEPANNGGTTSVEGGGFVQIDPRKAVDVGKAPGITWAPPDKLGGSNPNAGTGGGGSGASSNPGGNTTVVNNGAHDNTNGGGGNSNNGGGNGNGSQGQSGSTGFNPAF